jgi:anti-sigma-K factor RskA
MDDRRLDLSPLRPDPERAERAAGAILARARASLDARRRARGSVWGELHAWQRPLLAAAAAAAILSIVALIRVHPAERGGHVATLSEEAGIPAPFAGWLDSDQPPDPATLLEW